MLDQHKTHTRTHAHTHTYTQTHTHTHTKITCITHRYKSSRERERARESERERERERAREHSTGRALLFATCSLHLGLPEGPYNGPFPDCCGGTLVSPAGDVLAFLRLITSRHLPLCSGPPRPLSRQSPGVATLTCTSLTATPALALDHQPHLLISSPSSPHPHLLISSSPHLLISSSPHPHLLISSSPFTQALGPGRGL